MKYLVAAFATLLVLAFGVGSAAAAAPGVTVLGPENETVAVFKTAKCSKAKKSKNSFYIDSVSTDGKYVLLGALLNNFSGFHTYDLELNAGAADYLRVSEKGSSDGGWSNEFVPPFPVPGFGQIKFSSNGKQVGIGFGPGMWNRDFSSAVVLAGGLECIYPKKGKGKK